MGDLSAVGAVPKSRLTAGLPAAAGTRLTAGAGWTEALEWIRVSWCCDLAIREPVSGDEVLRVVQRRLFSNLGDEIQRQQVASAYAESFRGFLLAGGTSAQLAYQQAEQLHARILLSYPFHPALLDLMRVRWSALPSYQRTRGALQFLATAVHALWAGNVQTQPLLGAGDVPLFNANTMHNLVVEPMVEESNARILEEQVEE